MSRYKSRFKAVQIQAEQVKVVYNSVEITYIEGRNLWQFELRGRTRTAGSLNEAKVAIDKTPKAKRKPFERVEVIECRNYKYAGDHKIVTVTSYAGKERYGDGHLFYTIDPNGDKSKQSASRLILNTPENRERMEVVTSLTKQAKSFGIQAEKEFAKLERIKPTKAMLEEI
jgi:hypothetical protein